MYNQNNMYQDDRQLEISLTSQWFGEIPKYMPMRLNTDDFVFFTWPQHLNPQNFMVVMSVNSTAGSLYRSIGPLKKQVELPYNKFDAYAVIGVIPKSDPRLPSFWQRLNRASTYHIPHNYVPGGQHMMARSGVLTSAVTLDNLL